MPATTVPPFFIRNYLGQDPSSPTGGIWSVSPDVIVSGTSLSDWAPYTSPTGYTTQYASALALRVPNFVWVRGLDTTEAGESVRIWLYLAESDLLFWPNQCWISSAVSVAGRSVNYQTLTAPAKGVGLTPLPFVVTPPPPQLQGAQYALIALAEAQPFSDPPNPPLPADFDSLDQLSAWASATPTVGFLYPGLPAPAPAIPHWTSTTNVTFPQQGTYNVGYALAGMPTDATVACFMAGPTIADSVLLPPATVTNPNQQVTAPVTVPSSFSSAVSLTVWAGATPIPAGASIRVLCYTPQ